EPSGLVVLAGAEAPRGDAVPVLINALAEGGGFEYDGRVPADRATFVLLMDVGQGRLGSLESAQDFEHGLKDHLVAQLALANGGDEPAQAMALALRRRVDLVLPAWDPAAEQAAYVQGLFQEQQARLQHLETDLAQRDRDHVQARARLEEAHRAEIEKHQAQVAAWEAWHAQQQEGAEAQA
ncbi:hypothetical protein H632_c248p3, partial [Helicosporidium sp. ATCC 50920]